MGKISNIINKEQVTYDELFIALDEVKKAGNVFILKMDGERENHNNTIMITFPNSNKEMIRYDNSDLKEAIKMALKDYSLIIK